MATKEEIQERIGKKVSNIPSDFAMGVVTNPEFQKAMNKYMLRTHVVWGAFMAATIVGLWNIILALNIPPAISGSVSLSVGLLGLLFSALPLYRKKRGSVNESKAANVQ